MTNAPFSDQLELLRVQLETTLTPPLMLVVSSARDDDGKAVVAQALAQSMQAAGYATLLVAAGSSLDSLAESPASLADVLQFGIDRYAASSPRLGVQTLVLPRDVQQTISRQAVIAFAELCKGTYAVTIVDSATMLATSFAMLAAAASGGVLLTAREGRRVQRDDRVLAKRLAGEDIPFIGVISVSAECIRRGAPGGTTRVEQAKPSAMPGLSELPST